MKKLFLDGTVISEHDPVYIIAEIGVNHNGSPEIAHRLVDAAVEAGANAVKFQLFRHHRLLAPSADLAWRKTLAGLELEGSAMRRLKEHCSGAGITFLCTPFDLQSASLLQAMRVPAFKVSSGDITNRPLLELLAGYGKPVLLSTGMSGLKEIEEAMQVLSAVPAAVLHCTSDYPARDEDLHLNVIHTLKSAFNIVTGYSDHSPGLEVPLAACALGYKIIEKHFTLDRSSPGPDHPVSLEPDTFKQMVQGIRRIERAMGQTVKRATAREEEMKRKSRRSLYAAGSLPQGKILTAGDIIALRPLAGIEANHWPEVMGKRLRNDKEKGQELQWPDLF